MMLEYYDLELGIEWKWQALDGVMTKAPMGGEATGPAPCRSWEIRDQAEPPDRRLGCPARGGGDRGQH
jgi:hypothetical protein